MGNIGPATIRALLLCRERRVKADDAGVEFGWDADFFAKDSLELADTQPGALGSISDAKSPLLDQKLIGDLGNRVERGWAVGLPQQEFRHNSSAFSEISGVGKLLLQFGDYTAENGRCVKRSIGDLRHGDPEELMKSSRLKLNCKHVEPAVEDEVSAVMGAWPDDDCPRGKVSHAGLVGVNDVAFLEIELQDLIGPRRNWVDDSGGARLRLALLEAPNVIAERGSGKDRVQPRFSEMPLLVGYATRTGASIIALRSTWRQAAVTRVKAAASPGRPLPKGRDWTLVHRANLWTVYGFWASANGGFAGSLRDRRGLNCT